MTIEEARTLLTQYADGILEAKLARELESVLAETPALQAELKQLKEENELLEEALAPLRASKSKRMRVSDAMVNVHRQATNVAESLPERGWRIFRLCFCLASLCGAAAMLQFHPPSAETLVTDGILLVTTACVFGLGLIFLLWGNALAQAESRFTGAFRDYNTKPSALGVLLVQVFGAAIILGALGMYWWTV